MKKYTIASLLMFIPFVSMAADHCTNPKEYTIDKRCYVTQEQKQQAPYNSVVGLLDENGEVHCTGTLAAFTSWSKSAKVPRDLITAKHCVKDLPKKLTVRLQDGRELDADFVETTGADISSGSWAQDTAREDWAIYRFSGDVSIFPEIEPVYIKNQDVPVGTFISVVGYGGLKIMSDTEIEEFKQKYLEHLKQVKNVVPGTGGRLTYDGTDTGIKADGSIYADNDMVNSFIRDTLARSNKANNAYVWELFRDKRLKISKCKYQDEQNVCQIWNGNSGGPIFDNRNNLVGVLSTGWGLIGGEKHAAMGELASTKSIYEDGQFATKPKVIVTKGWNDESK